MSTLQYKRKIKRLSKDVLKIECRFRPIVSRVSLHLLLDPRLVCKLLQHAWNAECTLMSPSATPAMQSGGPCRQVPRLPHKQPRRQRRQTGPKRATRANPVPYVPRLPCKVTVDVTKRHACHVKWRWMSPSATQSEGRCHQVPRLPRQAVCERVVCVCEQIVCEGVFFLLCVCKLCVCVSKLCVSKLCVSVWASCAWTSCVWASCVWASCE